MSSDSPAEASKNYQISSKIVEASKRDKLTIKLLLLGAGDSGKTTIRKQMRNLYGEGFSESVRRQLAPVIIGNLIEGAKDVLNASLTPQIAIPMSTPAAKQAMEAILATSLGNESLAQNLSPEQAEALQTLWNDPGFQEVFNRRAEYQLQDCWQSFIKQVKNFPEWGGPAWIPSVADCIIARVRTSGIVEEQFVIEGVTFKLFDVGGQRAERRKWIHCFDSVTAIIFVVALSEYDQVLYEDRSKNRLEEAVELFDEICNSRWFVNTSTLLFLNKKDIFDEKFLKRKIPLNESGKFKNAPSGDDVTSKAAIEWMQRLFISVNRNPRKEIYTHITTATDPQNVRAVFDTCKNIILKRNLEASGFLMDN